MILASLAEVLQESQTFSSESSNHEVSMKEDASEGCSLAYTH